MRDQVKEALADIRSKIADIKAVESILTSTRSFLDLKHELDTVPTLMATLALETVLEMESDVVIRVAERHSQNRNALDCEGDMRGLTVSIGFAGI